MIGKKIVTTEEGMRRTGEYITKLRRAQQNGLIDNIPTTTDILAELIINAKATTERHCQRVWNYVYQRVRLWALWSKNQQEY